MGQGPVQARDLVLGQMYVECQRAYAPMDTAHLQLNRPYGADKQGEGGQDGQHPERQPGIVIKPWQPDMPYLKELRAAKDTADASPSI